VTTSVTLRVNGIDQRADAEPTEPLLRTLRDRLGLTGTKDGCSEGECGACTVLVDGQPIDSCLMPILAVVGREITTIEAIAEGGALSRVQEGMVRAGAVQCGFCTPGFVMTLTALLRAHPSPTPSEIRTAIAGNICRCTGYRQIVDAVSEVACSTP
jgi:aerobic carbon-monoxide dehydrogenase small subunit